MHPIRFNAKFVGVMNKVQKILCSVVANAMVQLGTYTSTALNIGLNKR
jgi:hypothetical protein